MNMERIEFEPEELSVAEQWHGGQSSMLYAIVSTGALSRSPFERCRPRAQCDACESTGRIFRGEAPIGISPFTTCEACRGAHMTDEQWLAYLAERLENEASETADEARIRAKRARLARRRDEAREMADHAVVLDGIAVKCREAIAELGGES